MKKSKLFFLILVFTVLTFGMGCTLSTVRVRKFPERKSWSALDTVVGPVQVVKGATAIVSCPILFLADYGERTSKMNTWQKASLPVFFPLLAILDYAITAPTYIVSGFFNTVTGGYIHRKLVLQRSSVEEPWLGVECAFFDLAPGGTRERLYYDVLEEGL